MSRLGSHRGARRRSKPSSSAFAAPPTCPLLAFPSQTQTAQPWRSGRPEDRGDDGVVHGTPMPVWLVCGGLAVGCENSRVGRCNMASTALGDSHNTTPSPSHTHTLTGPPTQPPHNWLTISVINLPGRVDTSLVLSCLVSFECTLWEGFFWRMPKQAYTVPCRASHTHEQGAQVLCT